MTEPAPWRQTWDLPAEPGDKVRAVRTVLGSLYLRTDEGWRYEEKPEGSKSDTWDFLIRYGAPLVDATCNCMPVRDPITGKLLHAYACPAAD